MERDRLMNWLNAATEGLRPAAGSSTEALDLAKELMSRALEVRGLDALRDLATPLARIDIDVPGTATTPALAAGDDVARVVARDLATDTLFDLGFGRDAARGLLPSRVLGPFRAIGGLLRWFDIYGPARALRVHIGADPAPALLFTSARLPRRPGASYVIDLEPGSIWIRATLLVPSAPAGAYVGFRITDGKLTLPSTPAVVGDVLTAPSTPRHLELTLAPPAPDPVEPKCDGFSVTPPTRLELSWAGASGAPPTARIGPGDATIHGSTLTFASDGGALVAPTFDPALDAVVFGCSISPDRWDASTLSAKLATLSGATRLDSAGWAVPLTRPATPTSLGEASGEGYWTAQAREALVADWLGAARSDTALHDARLLISTRRFVVASRAARPAHRSMVQRFALWKLEGNEHRLPLDVDLRADFLWLFQCDKVSGEALYLSGSIQARLDRPIDATGQPLSLSPQAAIIVLTHADGEAMAHVLGLPPPADASGPAPAGLALENGLLLIGDRFLALVRGRLISATDVESGEAVVALGVIDWIPTLPDPYVTDWACHREPPRRQRGGRALVVSVLRWEAGGRAQVRFDGALPELTRTCERPQSSGSPGPAPRQRGVRLDATQTQQGTQTRDAKGEERWAGEQRRAFGELADRREATTATNARLEAILSATSARRMGVMPEGPMLLDVSTRRHQIGVRLGAWAEQRVDSPTFAAPPAASSSITRFRLAAMTIATPIANLRVVTVPAVQWEPVRTLDADQDLAEPGELGALGYFPTPLASADDGGPTVIGARSATLVAAIPELALDTMITEFTGGGSLAMVTTLPFGLKVAMALQPTAIGARSADQVLYVRPRFDAPALEGALQMSVRAAGGIEVPNEQSPSFTGVAAQLLNGVDLNSGTPLGISVLGATSGSAASVESMFNNEFALQRPRVPLTRLDISGYGSTTFSDWANPRGAFAEATKVQFQLLVGRTALEVIKFASVLYPWGIRVTRSVTIERRSGGGVIRRDSGWQASSPGLFDFRYTEEDPGAPGTWIERPSPFTFHPGLLRGLFDVQRIRPSDAPPVELASTLGAVRLQPMYFDAVAKIVGAPGGATHSRGVLGFLHVLPVGRPITAEDLEALILSQSAIGGPIDALLDAGGSGLAVRALRFEVDTAREAAGPRFVGAVRGAPRFGSAGAWSVCRMPGPTNTSAPGDATAVEDGVPLIREGAAATPVGDTIVIPGPQGDLRFAAAADLFRAAAPAYDYGFLQATPTHSFVFRRPIIQPGPGASRIRSTLAPCFADIFARFAAKGLFPPVAGAVTLTDRTYELAVNASTGVFRLDPPVHFPSPRPTLALSESSSERVRVLYNETTLALSIEEASWSLEMPNLVVWSDVGGIQQLVGTRLRLVGSTMTRPQLTDIESLINPALQAALTFLPGFNPVPKQGPVELQASNLGLKGKVSMVAKKEFHIGKYVEIELSAQIDLGGDSRSREDDPPTTGADDFYIGGKFGAELQAKIPIHPIAFIVLGAEAEIGGKVYFLGALAGRGRAEVEFKVYAGVGVGTVVGPFAAYAFLAGGLVIEWDLVKNDWHYGWLVLFEAAFDVAAVKVKVNAECTGVGKKQLMGGVERDIVEYTGELAVNIELFWIISIKFTWGISDEMELS